MKIFHKVEHFSCIYTNIFNIGISYISQNEDTERFWFVLENKGVHLLYLFMGFKMHGLC